MLNDLIINLFSYIYIYIINILKLSLNFYIYLLIILYNCNITASVVFKKKDIYNTFLVESE